MNAWPVDLPIVRFGKDDKDVWRLEDACQGTLILGETRSGKTSGSGAMIARKFLESGFGGLVLCFKSDPGNPKNDEAQLWKSYLKRYGREQDGRFFSEEGEHRFNFLDYEKGCSGLDFTENLVTLLVDVASVQKRSSSSGGSEDSFWRPQREMLMRNAFALMMMAEKPIELRTLYAMIRDVAQTTNQLDSPTWQKRSALWKMLLDAERISGTHPEWETVRNYWSLELPELHEKTRGTVFADIKGMLDPLTRGKIGELFGTTTNLSPDDIFAGKIIVIDIPVAKRRAAGQFAALVWSQLFQRATDRRSYQAPYSRPVFLWTDEAHHFTVEQDAVFQTTAAAKGIAVVRLSQNVANFRDAYGRDGEHKVNTLLGNLNTKFLHRNSEPFTNKWATEVIAKETLYRISMAASGPWNGGHLANTSVAEVEEDSCSPKEFMGLKNGGKKNDYIAEAVLFQSGRLWNKDQRWVRVGFKQT